MYLEPRLDPISKISDILSNSDIGLNCHAMIFIDISRIALKTRAVPITPGTLLWQRYRK